MKKGIRITLIIFGIIILIVGGIVLVWLNNVKGNISEVNIISVESNVYSKDEINSAIDVTLNNFKNNFHGCILKELSYIGDDKNKSYEEWAVRYNKENVIVFLSKFKTTSFSDGSLNPNSEYSNWNWILVKDKNEKWKLVDHGY